ncbi:MAG: hypothetical protein SXQ77_00620 [Halobacteria archaeon]|nr:hypothetical protein [Halobacteria archaeon]
MEKREIVKRLLDDARQNRAFDAVVIDVPETVIEEHGGVLSADEDEYGRKINSTLFAGPVQKEDSETITLRTPSRVGERDDFSDNIRQKLGPERLRLP